MLFIYRNVQAAVAYLYPEHNAEGAEIARPVGFFSAQIIKFAVPIHFTLITQITYSLLKGISDISSQPCESADQPNVHNRIHAVNPHAPRSIHNVLTFEKRRTSLTSKRGLSLNFHTRKWGILPFQIKHRRRN